MTITGGTLICGVSVLATDLGMIVNEDGDEDQYQFVEDYRERVLKGTGLSMLVVPHDRCLAGRDTFIIGYTLSEITYMCEDEALEMVGLDIVEKSFANVAKDLPDALKSRPVGLYMVPNDCACCS